MHRGSRLSFALVGTLGMVAFEGAAQDRRDAGFGGPVAGLDTVQERAFRDGREEFREAEDVADGLGPVFNERSCAACHSAQATGGGGNRTVTRFGRVTNQGFDELIAQGGSLIQARGIGEITTRNGNTFNFAGETVPAEATVVTRRRTPPLFGLGLVDAVPDATFIELARVGRLRNDGTAGRPNFVVNLSTGRSAVGKFGWKSQVPTLLQFAGDAYLNEMGITSPQFADEVCPQGDCSRLDFNPTPALNDDGTDVRALTDFMTMLGPPPRGEVTAETVAGEAAFRDAGCESCHVSTLRTGPHSIAALNDVSFRPYSDFLLHDMGTLGDGIEQGLATGREFRTAPLWGVRTQRRLLHDGSASSIEDAITRHAGQAQRSRDRFDALDAERRAALLAFLRSL